MLDVNVVVHFVGDSLSHGPDYVLYHFILFVGSLERNSAEVVEIDHDANDEPDEKSGKYGAVQLNLVRGTEWGNIEGGNDKIFGDADHF